MLNLEQAQAALLAAVRPCRRTETVPVTQALGRYVAAELRARTDHPGFDNSAMDGYAVRVADLAAHGFRLPLAGEVRCGAAPGTLASATAQRIFTGAPLPAGADTVVMQEDVQVENGAVTLPRSVAPNQNLRRRGEDFHLGDVLYAPGRRLTAWDLALLATAGVAEVAVYARPRALVVATGDELVAPGTPLKPGQIYESNRLATLSLLAQLGADVSDGGTVRDDPAALRALLARAGDFANGTKARAAGRKGSPTRGARSSRHEIRPDGGFDFIVTSGGASVGDYDVVKQVFAEIGEIKFWKVRIKPGKPIAFGHVGERTHFFALPGNPVSSLVTFKLFVEPAVYAWHHARAPMLTLLAQAANGFHRRPGRTEFLRARLYNHDGRLLVDALKGQGSHMLGPLRETNVLIRVEAESDGFEAGSTVTVIPLGAEF
ncbi:MAG: molybdopterin molybdotransferase MoeA [Gammaproteobacteria bacterium]|nr:molybdopterin molybdotransferase MoeA [Gammaproteobacteria bacterium]